VKKTRIEEREEEKGTKRGKEKEKHGKFTEPETFRGEK
jgi:hypothetical protein